MPAFMLRLAMYSTRRFGRYMEWIRKVGELRLLGAKRHEKSFSTVNKMMSQEGQGRQLLIGKRVRLLVDADAIGADMVTQAIALLQNHAKDVSTEVFLAAGAGKQMRKMLQRQVGVKFRAIPREKQHQLGEANDEAILLEMHTLVTKAEVDCIALMTNDRGFSSTMKQLSVSSNTRFVVLISERKPTVIAKYEADGMPVFRLQASEVCTRVRAILEANGNGSVHLAEPYDSFANLTKMESVWKASEEFFQRTGRGHIAGDTKFWIHDIAKLFYAKGLGPLVVFPWQLAMLALYDASSQIPQHGWSLDSDELAYFLPITSMKIRIPIAKMNKYGSRLACSIFEGGGPFILKDSDDLVVQALWRLGYLDDSFNSDLLEAMMVFVNAANNKRALRLLGVTLDSADTTSDIVVKLRSVFRSHRHCGVWQLGGTSDPAIMNILKSEKLLPHSMIEPSSEEIFHAMKNFARVHKLEAMRTYNGLASRILQYKTPNDPRRRGEIVIKR